MNQDQPSPDRVAVELLLVEFADNRLAHQANVDNTPRQKQDYFVNDLEEATDAILGMLDEAKAHGMNLGALIEIENQQERLETQVVLGNISRDKAETWHYSNRQSIKQLHKLVRSKGADKDE